jgi:hypothetical protein
MTVVLASLVREAWATLLAEGFSISSEDAHRVELTSPNLALVVTHDPRGEVEVRAIRPGTNQHYGWSYTGMVGRADVARLLEIALGKMRADPAILAGDPDFYAEVARQKEATAQAWTEFAAGRGPRPRERKLP